MLNTLKWAYDWLRESSCSQELLEDIDERITEVKIEMRRSVKQEPVAYIKDRELGYMLAVREVGAKDWRTNLGLYPEKGDVPLYTAPPPAFQEIEELNELYMAAKNVIDWIERAYRPPVLDEFETGRMVKVRLHALADLNDAIESINKIRAKSPCTDEEPLYTSTQPQKPCVGLTD
jgi:hypothetical protein